MKNIYEYDTAERFIQYGFIMRKQSQLPLYRMNDFSNFLWNEKVANDFFFLFTRVHQILHDFFLKEFIICES